MIIERRKTGAVEPNLTIHRMNEAGTNREAADDEDPSRHSDEVSTFHFLARGDYSE
jgi:hypothetical protein